MHEHIEAATGATILLAVLFLLMSAPV